MVSTDVVPKGLFVVVVRVEGIKCCFGKVALYQTELFPHCAWLQHSKLGVSSSYMPP